MINGFMYLTICNSNDTIKLSANYDFKKEKYYFPYLEFSNIYWDNESFIFETFYDFLIRYVDHRLVEASDDKLFEELKDLLTDDWAADMIEIIEQGLKFNWDKL